MVSLRFDDELLSRIRFITGLNGGLCSGAREGPATGLPWIWFSSSDSSSVISCTSRFPIGGLSVSSPRTGKQRWSSFSKITKRTLSFQREIIKFSTNFSGSLWSCGSCSRIHVSRSFLMSCHLWGQVQLIRCGGMCPSSCCHSVLQIFSSLLIVDCNEKTWNCLWGKFVSWVTKVFNEFSWFSIYCEGRLKESKFSSLQNWRNFP